MLPNRYKGKLIVAEGIPGSGKSAQISLLSHWLRAQGYAVAFTSWNPSAPVKATIEWGRTHRSFTPATFSLIHATDFADRMESYIMPLIKAGAVVCADGYAAAAFARDVARGASRPWVRNLYNYALRPSLTLYFRVPVEVAISRIPGGIDSVPYYEAGMDLGLSRNTDESYRLFQGRILAEYEAMAGEMEFHVIDATLSIEEQQRRMRQTVVDCLGEVLRTGVLRSAPKGSPPGSPKGSPKGSDGIATAAAVL
jgi:dTMP kinase